ncbi:uncharacterized protein LOC143219721 [Lasioglossum baleicum]|uniref:uncharacterized protein LOC143219721 n=1 Tax=Lasioglossum baleicum TaxID=434251 RepID=UPI003FCD1CA8
MKKYRFPYGDDDRNENGVQDSEATADPPSADNSRIIWTVCRECATGVVPGDVAIGEMLTADTDNEHQLGQKGAETGRYWVVAVGDSKPKWPRTSDARIEDARTFPLRHWTPHSDGPWTHRPRRCFCCARATHKRTSTLPV